MNGVGVWMLALHCPLARHQKKKKFTVELDEMLLKMQI